LIEEDDVEIYGRLGRSLRPLRDLWCLLRLIGELISRPCDVLHTHTTKAGLLGRIAVLLSSFLLRLGGCSRVKTLHTYHGHVFHGYFSPRCTWWVLQVERFLARSTDHIVVISESQGREIGEALGLPQERLALVPLGLDLEPMLAVERKPVFDSDGGNFVIGWIGRMVPIKGIPLLLEIIAHCREHWRFSKRPRFVIVGGGEMQEFFESELKARDLERLVDFAGWRMDMVEVLSGMDVVLNTSLNEGTSVALIEAQAAGVPVVATGVGGTVDVCVSSSSLYKPGGVVQAHLALESIFAHSRRVDLHERQGIVRRHDPDLLSERLLKLMGAQF
jgi:glycosyltransferase involved in cell wall biosynthesis